MTTREETIASIRQLADLLEKSPDLPIPHELGAGQLSIDFWDSSDAKAKLLSTARLIPGPMQKRVWGGGKSGLNYYTLEARVGCLNVHMTAYRDAVCERVVTGSREVTETVPDPAVVVPMVEVTKTVEDVEWVCAPLLSDKVDSQAAYSKRLTELEPDGIPVAHTQVDLAGALRDSIDRAKAARS